MQRVFRQTLWGAGLLAVVSSAAAQDDGRGDRFTRFLDRDGNGLIEPHEVEQMPGPFRERLQSSGLDLSRPVRTDQFVEDMRRRYEEMRRSSDSGGDRGSGGWGGDRGPGGWGGGPPGGWGSGGWSGRGDDRGSSSGSRSSTSTSTAKPLVKREPVTLPLPSAFTAGDTDRDGQIGFYEWKTWKGRGALHEFLTLDRNHDGFLTPRELAAPSGQPASPPPAAGAAPPIAAAVPPTTTTSAVAPTTAPATSSPTAGGPASSDPRAAAARRYFALMDRNHDGQLTTEEWAGSQRIRPMFEKAGISLAQPMPETDFINHYVRLAPPATES